MFSIPAEGGEWDLLPGVDREEYFSLFFRFYLAVQRGLAVGPDKVQYLQTLDRSDLCTIQRVLKRHAIKSDRIEHHNFEKKICR